MNLIADTFSHIVLSHRKTVTLNIFLSVFMRCTILIYNMSHLIVSLLKEIRQGSDNCAHRLRLLFLYFGESLHKRVHVCYLFFDSSQRCPAHFYFLVILLFISCPFPRFLSLRSPFVASFLSSCDGITGLTRGGSRTSTCSLFCFIT